MYTNSQSHGSIELRFDVEYAAFFWSEIFYYQIFSLSSTRCNKCPEMILPYNINIDPIVVEEEKKDSSINKYFSQDPRNKVIKI